MSKSRRLLIGILSFLPIVLLLTYFIVFFGLMLQMLRHAQLEDMQPPAMMFEHIGLIMGFGLLMFALHFGLLIYFIVHAVNNTGIDGTERLIWILVFIFAGMIGYPVYWYMRIWKDLPPR